MYSHYFSSIFVAFLLVLTIHSQVFAAKPTRDEFVRNFRDRFWPRAKVQAANSIVSPAKDDESSSNEAETSPKTPRSRPTTLKFAPISVRMRNLDTTVTRPPAPRAHPIRNEFFGFTPRQRWTITTPSASDYDEQQTTATPTSEHVNNDDDYVEFVEILTTTTSPLEQLDASPTTTSISRPPSHTTIPQKTSRPKTTTGRSRETEDNNSKERANSQEESKETEKDIGATQFRDPINSRAENLDISHEDLEGSDVATDNYGSLEQYYDDTPISVLSHPPSKAIVISLPKQRRTNNRPISISHGTVIRRVVRPIVRKKSESDERATEAPLLSSAERYFKAKRIGARAPPPHAQPLRFKQYGSTADNRITTTTSPFDYIEYTDYPFTTAFPPNRGSNDRTDREQADPISAATKSPKAKRTEGGGSEREEDRTGDSNSKVYETESQKKLPAQETEFRQEPFVPTDTEVNTFFKEEANHPWRSRARVRGSLWRYAN
uniref:Uncharacterized protein n=1 Tax=Plectus sambesii TaxID=2011161 RepID=A0A914VVY9_9BILA